MPDKPAGVLLQFFFFELKEQNVLLKISSLSTSCGLESREPEKKERDGRKGKSASSWGASLKTLTHRLAGCDVGVCG